MVVVCPGLARNGALHPSATNTHDHDTHDDTQPSSIAPVYLAARWLAMRQLNSYTLYGDIYVYATYMHEIYEAS